MKAIGLDIGSVTVGIAISDSLMMFASSYDTIRYEVENDELFTKIVDVIKKEEIDVIVVGMPYHMNGDFSEGCERTKRFEEKIKALINLPIVEIDERLSTVSATNALLKFDVNRKKRHEVVDKVAATVILQTYLDKRSYSNGK